MFQELDCRGLNCPHPVINTKKALEQIQGGTITAIVDNEAAKENLLKFAKGMNFAAEVIQPQEGEFHVTIHKGEEISLSYTEAIEDVRGSYAVFVTSNILGKGNDELGAGLIKSFFYALTEQDKLPVTIAFLNSGVKLTCEESPVLEHIMHLESKGADILSCGTCLDYYNLKEKLCVGTISNMYTILEKLLLADKTITI